MQAAEAQSLSFFHIVDTLRERTDEPQIGVLVQVSLLASLGGMNTAIINPAYVPLSKEFGITTVTASYQTTVVIALNGVAPFIWIPLADVYGRRPVYLASTLLGFVSV